MCPVWYCSCAWQLPCKCVCHAGFISRNSQGRYLQLRQKVSNDHVVELAWTAVDGRLLQVRQNITERIEKENRCNKVALTPQRQGSKRARNTALCHQQKTRKSACMLPRLRRLLQRTVAKPTAALSGKQLPCICNSHGGLYPRLG